MFYLFKPTEKEINKLIQEQSDLDFSYESVGATRDKKPPEGFPTNHHRKKVGSGEETFQKAIEAIHSWQMYALDWTQIKPKNVPIKKGEIVLTMISHLGFWSLNPCRIIYLTDEKTESTQKFGFAFGTLPAHAESGEEKFEVEWNLETDEVFYEIYAFARPENPWAKLTSPYVTYLQKSFAAESHQAMLRFINGD